MEQIKKITLYSNSGADSLSVIRVLGPAQKIGLEVLIGAENGKVDFDLAHKGDVIVFQRDFSEDLNSYEKLHNYAHLNNKLVVFELDDLLFALPDKHPDKISGFFSNSLMPMFKTLITADIVTVASRPLKEQLNAFNSNIFVFPNYLDDGIWKIRNPRAIENSDKKIIIGYMGGNSHVPDLQMVTPALMRLVQKYPNNIEFKFWGIKPPEELRMSSSCDWVPPKSLLYSDFVTYFQTQYADIVIAPLVDNLFNSCKSSIKYLEYSANGFPGVYSKVLPYEDIIENGVDGFLATEIDDWVEKLSLLIEDKNLRMSIAINAQRKIKSDWLMSNNANKLLKIYETGLALRKSANNKKKINITIINSLTRQIYENQQSYNKTIADLHKMQIQHTLNTEQLHQLEKIKIELIDLQEKSNENKRYTEKLMTQIEEIEQKNNELILANKIMNEELITYAISKSWQVTRPFRKLYGILNKRR